VHEGPEQRGEEEGSERREDQRDPDIDDHAASVAGKADRPMRAMLALSGARPSLVAMAAVELALSAALSLVVVPWVVRAAGADVHSPGAG
jgi:hypothetical protein